MNVFEGYRKYFLVQNVVVRGHCERKQSRLEARGNTQETKNKYRVAIEQTPNLR